VEIACGCSEKGRSPRISGGEMLAGRVQHAKVRACVAATTLDAFLIGLDARSVDLVDGGLKIAALPILTRASFTPPDMLMSHSVRLKQFSVCRGGWPRTKLAGAFRPVAVDVVVTSPYSARAVTVAWQTDGDGRNKQLTSEARPPPPSTGRQRPPSAPPRPLLSSSPLLSCSCPFHAFSGPRD